MRPKLAIAAWLIVTFLTDVSAQPASTIGLTSEELFGSMVRRFKWRTLEIPVCWENPNSRDIKERQTVRSAIEENWQRYSALTFPGWGKCSDHFTKGIRIRISDERPRTIKLGRLVSGRRNGMILNFNFQRWGRDCSQHQEFCLRALAVHEFGHALGFTHEQNRSDAPDECRGEATGAVGDYNVTRYDPSSVMNYCRSIWNGNGNLSALDIQAVQTVYGRQ
ncbi:ATPase [Sinorhizobium meliloti]|nr:ATPase [Sinorhizobium meliloti]MDW9654092.1 ATPase [Sinorhizobium meliloti]MDW9914506.1 ATPase [Sinorhizobium meliloti]MDW9937972.1 ATPase [Sinorhizobium meliloti]MDW9945703.1 ATPase [Sinorhizobium meliloti]